MKQKNVRGVVLVSKKLIEEVNNKCIFSDFEKQFLLEQIEGDEYD